MKKLLLSFCMLLSALGNWAHDFEVDGIYYKITSSTDLTVAVTFQGSKYYDYMDEYAGSVSIPETATYNAKTYSVTSIGDDAFHGCSGLTSVIIPNSVTTIGWTAFSGCSGLSSIAIPNSVTEIGIEAFYGCKGLTKADFSSVESLCGIVFNSYSANPLYYAHHLYINGKEIKNLVIPNSVTKIGNSTFSGCSGQTSITIPNSVTSIGNSAFYESGLTSISIPNSVTSIGNSAFEKCSLTSITIPNSVTEIGGSAFEKCSSLTSVTIPNSVISIGSSAFAFCTGLVSATIGNGVASFPDNVFQNCSGLTSVSINSDAIASKTYFKSHTLAYIFGSQVKAYIFGEGVKSIGGNACRDCTDLTSVTIANSVTSIGGGAFQGCSGLSKAEFASIENLCKIKFGDGTANPLSCAHHLYINGKEIKNLVIPNNVTEIGNFTFSGCTDLTSIAIPNSVTSIDFQAFAGCRGLTSITIPNSVISIGELAFSGCYFLSGSFINNSALSDDNNWGATICDVETNDGLLIKENTVVRCRPWATSVTIPNSVTSIGEWAFSGCSGLTSVTIPNSVTSIGNSAFNGCTGLSSANISNSVTNISKDAFKDCTGLTKAEFSSIESLCGINFGNADANPLKNAHHLYISGEEIKKVDIPNSITSIKQYAFYGCTDINTVNIPSSVTAIGDYAFAECSGLKFITCDSKTPPTAYNNSFPSAIALVPVDAQNEYKNATGWKNLIFNQAFTLLATTQTTITLQTSELIKEQSVRLSDDKVFTGTSDIIRITGLRPATRYTLRASGRYEDTTLENTIVATTKSINVSVEASVTNTTINLKSNYDAGDATVSYARFDGFDEGNEITITGLDPGVSRTIYFRVGTEDGSEFKSGGTYTTQKITAGGKVLARTASSVTLKGTLTGWIDANIINIGFRDNDYKSDEVKITGLRPDYSDTRRFLADFGNGYYSEYYISFKTNELTLETQQPKVISEGNVIVAAKSNLDDDETNVGFEWRRQDWTDDFDSKTGGAYLYNGEMEGYIRNINANYLWKFRPYYEANDGTRYYGEWKGLDPSDYSYFEPTVHTYASVTVNENTAEVKGYAQRGTDNVTSQGFLYWPSSTANVKAEQPMRVTDVPSDALKVTAKGTVMNAKLTDLLYNTTYSYVAFVETSEGETFYGEEMTFQTGEDLTGIVDVNDSGNVNNNTSNIYDLSGRKLARMQKGINIIRMSNGTVRKVLVK